MISPCAAHAACETQMSIPNMKRSAVAIQLLLVKV
ncbi:hypothetical protein STIAU_1693 [Stigmatella aurantiaca DW4/3-1]|uniref:Uncharacterized protein n=1 Tax=Stigmatella aurantiaca (strain DW4/3-1) TaxID=378806 RepID=Q095L0_STIAD|nr:hypothetical protein STIAU_1693 [Stigmatella aurantiaca DW4/3-1]